MPLIQNFSVPAADDLTVNFAVEGELLSGTDIFWQAFNQQHGVPSGSPIISKTLGDGIEITSNISPSTNFAVQLNAADTSVLSFGNYYHEVRIVEPGPRTVTLAYGIMTVTETEVVV